MKKNLTLHYSKLEGSEKASPRGVQVDTMNPNEMIEVTVRLRRKASIESHLGTGQRFTREEYQEKFGAAHKDITLLEEFAGEFHLMIGQIDPARRSVILKGRILDFENAFQVHLSHYRADNGHVFRGRVGHIQIPKALEGIVEGVFGLDNRSQLRPMFQIASTQGRFLSRVNGSSFNPNDLARIYKFPPKTSGAGQCIAIIELDGGFRKRDIKKYFTGLGIKEPFVSAVSIGGGQNQPSNASSADGEVMLDIEVAAAVAPDARIVVYFAPNTDEGFLNAITSAIHDNHYKPSVISISWGASEKDWTDQSLINFNEAFKAASLLGVTICAAAGDEGSSDGQHDGAVHADFPASSPYVLACGGTKLVMKGNKIGSETVWNESSNSATGGGVSEFFAVPDYQKKTKVPASASTGFKGRGLPDVAANADPKTGYNCLVDGEEMVIGGTSAVAPLMAGLVALLNEQRKQSVGFLNPFLYSHPQVCRDITVGNNITTTSQKGYKAGAGWDACTGWGVMSAIPKSLMP